MTLAENIAAVRSRIERAARQAGRDPQEITLCAATKTQSADLVRQAVAAGVGVCGENRVQEMCAKLDDYAYDGAALHFIGHLQTNKVKLVVGRVDCIESADSVRLLDEIERTAAALRRTQDVLIQVNIGREPQKGGVPPEQTGALCAYAAGLPHVRLRGLMVIPPASDAPHGSRPFFAAARQLFIDTRGKMRDNIQSDMTQLSMGMSGDFEDAVAEGATLVRVGSALFGKRS